MVQFWDKINRIWSLISYGGMTEKEKKREKLKQIPSFLAWKAE